MFCFLLEDTKSLKEIWKMGRGLRKNCCENFGLKIFMEFYFVEDLIVRRPPLLVSPEYLEGLIFSATFRSEAEEKFKVKKSAYQVRSTIS
jgi:hypothetical protein